MICFVNVEVSISSTQHLIIRHWRIAVKVRIVHCCRCHVEAVCTSRIASGVDGVNDHTEDRESGSSDVGRLGTDERRHGLVGGGVGLRLLDNRQDARFDESSEVCLSKYKVTRRLRGPVPCATSTTLLSSKGTSFCNEDWLGRVSPSTV